jgi:hypothetical protein
MGNILPGLPEDMPLAVMQKFQHDGAPLHYKEDDCQWLNTIYPGN